MNSIIWNQYSIQEKRSAKGYFLPAIIGLYNNISKVVKHVIKRGTGSSDTKNLLDGYWWVKNFIVKIVKILNEGNKENMVGNIEGISNLFHWFNINNIGKLQYSQKLCRDENQMKVIIGFFNLSQKIFNVHFCCGFEENVIGIFNESN